MVAMKQLTKYCRGFILSKERYYSQFRGLFTSVLPDFEKNCLSEFVESLQECSWFNDESEDKEVGILLTQLTDSMAKPSIEYLAFQILYNEKEILAIFEAIAMRERVEKQKLIIQKRQQKISNGLQMALVGKKSMLSKKTKEEVVAEFEVKLELVTKELESIDQLVNIITIIVGEYEIPRFKFEKMNNYYSALKTAIQNEYE